MNSSKIQNVTYLGVPYKVQTHYLNSNHIGKRVNVRHNLIDNYIEIRAIEGDGRTDDFKEHYSIILSKTSHDIDNKYIMGVVNNYMEKMIK